MHKHISVLEKMASGLLVTNYCEHCRGSQTHSEDKNTYKREINSKLLALIEHSSYWAKTMCREYRVAGGWAGVHQDATNRKWI